MLGRSPVRGKLLPRLPTGALAAEADGEIAIPRPMGYRSAIVAHELGHAQDFESRKYPRLRRAADVVGTVLGPLGEILSMQAGRPGLAALSALVPHISELSAEYVASRNAMKALRASDYLSEDELAQARKTLLAAGSTYGMSALGHAGGSALIAHLVNKFGLPVDSAFGASVGVRLLAGYLAGKVHRANYTNSPLLDEEQLQALRKQMQVAAQVYRSSEGVKRDAGGMYIPALSGKYIQPLLHRDVKTHDSIQTIMDEGGVIVPMYPLAKTLSREHGPRLTSR